jgi:hypothetical protein
MGIEGDVKISPRLKKHPGLDTNEIRSEQLAEVIKGVAESFELNDMYGRANLSDYSNSQQFIDKFLDTFTKKLQGAMKSSKFDKAQSPRALKKAQDTKDKLQYGIDYITSIFK